MMLASSGEREVRYNRHWLGQPAFAPDVGSETETLQVLRHEIAAAAVLDTRQFCDSIPPRPQRRAIVRHGDAGGIRKHQPGEDSDVGHREALTGYEPAVLQHAV